MIDFEYNTLHAGLDTNNLFTMKTTLLDQLLRSSEERFKADEHHIRINNMKYNQLKTSLISDHRNEGLSSSKGIKQVSYMENISSTRDEIRANTDHNRGNATNSYRDGNRP